MSLTHRHDCCTVFGEQKEIEPVKDESAQRFKDLQEEYTLYEAARKDPKQASMQVALLLLFVLWLWMMMMLLLEPRQSGVADDMPDTRDR